MAPYVAQDKHMERLALADLALDTRIYNGHTTTSDALWAGVPVITVKGRHFASRVSESILSAMDLAELVAEGLDAFECLAIEIAKDSARLEKLKEKIAAARGQLPLFDTERFVRNWERGLREIWQKYRENQTITPILIEDI